MKRLTLACAVFVCALTLTASAQEAIPSLEGWKPWRNPATGTTYYRCEAKACGQGALVSAKRQPDGPPESLVEFRKKTETTDQSLVKMSAGGYVSVKITKLYARDLGKLRTQIAVKTMGRADGGTEHTASALASFGPVRFSLVSTGASEAAVQANIERFVPLPFLAMALNDQKRSPR
ncbi:hypothetical protein [Methylopila capsulata]|nr:hypothetical protein [Methylopila capsulata]GLK55187.1 hypothetical protein GCM10008170_12060 [Methylopila capsulata]